MSFRRIVHQKFPFYLPLTFSVQVVGKGVGGRLVDDSKYVKVGDFSGVFGGLPLSAGECGWLLATTSCLRERWLPLRYQVLGAFTCLHPIS
ncbi:hypothetical protein LINGRAPRIM_LOCUS2181 [Linum grandiflorum]